jgi:hypothetical protein
MLPKNLFHKMGFCSPSNVEIIDQGARAQARKRRARSAAYNGAKQKNEVREEQNSNFSSTHLGKKIFFATLATRSHRVGAVMDMLDLSSFYLHERNELPRA